MNEKQILAKGLKVHFNITDGLRYIDTTALLMTGKVCIDSISTIIQAALSRQQ